MRRTIALLACSLTLVACGDDTEMGPDAALDPDGGPVDMRPPESVCDPNPCTAPDRGVCVEEDGAARCDCDPGFELEADTCVAAETCGPDTCAGHGTCSEDEAGLTCACELGYGGTFCDECDADAGYYDDGTGRCTLDACTPNPCTEDPTRRRCEVEAMRAVCVCNAGTHEEEGACVADTTCGPTTCSGHGECTEDGGAVSCACESGWVGTGCDECDEASGYHPDGMGGCTMDACLPNPCTEPNRGVCMDEGGVTCGCDPGTHLEDAGCVVDEVCEAATCSGNGTCAVVAGRTECTCDAGYTGGDCATCAMGYHEDGLGGCTMDPCLPNPCMDPLQSVCVAMGATATCECDPGAHPDGTGGCTTDPCVPDTCLAMNMACRAVDGAPECYTPECDDGNPCTDDAVVGGICRNTAVADGTACSTGICQVGESCSSGTCGGGAPRACDDGNPCTADFCSEPAGCGAMNDDSLVPPDDGVACTTGTCTAGAAAHVPTDALCSDGLWCNGDEVCAPGAGADADGCVVEDVPVAPGPSTPCASWRCDEAGDAWVQDTLATGASCDDGVACTSGDVCTASGVCLGTISGSCAPSGTCASTVPWTGTVDVGAAPVTGTITQNGATLPVTTPAYQNGVLWARAQDTGALHRLKIVNWRTGGGSYPNYQRSADADQFATLLIPGVYDVLWQRAYGDAAPEPYVDAQTRTPSVDPVVNGFRVIERDVIVPAGGRTLDVDVGATVVSGTITQNGATLPMTTPDYQNGSLWARARDTGALHRLKLVNWRTGTGGSYPNYMRSADADQYATLLIPGTYDLLWERAYGDASPEPYVDAQARSPYADPVVNGFRVVQTGVTIGGASQTVNVDLGVTEVSGTITQNGATLPMTTPDYQNGVLWARARDTGALHRLKLVNWRTGAGGSYPNYMRSADADQYTTLLIPGTYDLLWERAYGDASPEPYVDAQERSPTADPVVNGFRVLRTGVVIGGASQTVDVDLGATVVTGTITQNGTTLPMTTPAYENGVLWARAQDTGALHRLKLVNWRTGAGGSYPTYMRSADADQYATLLMPGTYDLLWQRAYGDASPEPYVDAQERAPTADPVVNGFRVLRTDVVIGGASQTVDVNLGALALGGTITQNGGLLPITTPAYENGVLWARARDTGALHRLKLVNWRTGGGSYPNYRRSDDANRFDTLVMPGAYDLLWQRAYGDATPEPYVDAQTRSPSVDPVVNGFRVLQECVALE